MNIFKRFIGPPALHHYLFDNIMRLQDENHLK